MQQLPQLFSKSRWKKYDFKHTSLSFFSKFFSHYNSHHCSHHSWWLIDDANHHKLFNSPFRLCRSHQWPSWRELNKHQGQCQHQPTIPIQIIPPIQQQTLQSCSDDADDGNQNHTQVKYWQWSNIKNSRQRKKSVLKFYCTLHCDPRRSYDVLVEIL
jgi:hypothetical protein